MERLGILDKTILLYPKHDMTSKFISVFVNSHSVSIKAIKTRNSATIALVPNHLIWLCNFDILDRGPGNRSLTLPRKCSITLWSSQGPTIIVISALFLIRTDWTPEDEIQRIRTQHVIWSISSSCKCQSFILFGGIIETFPLHSWESSRKTNLLCQQRFAKIPVLTCLAILLEQVRF